METTDQSDVYFAAKDAEVVANVALKRSETFFANIRSNFYLDKLINNWRAYHGVYTNNLSMGHKIGFTGEQGELTQIPVNHFRNLARHMFNMITANRPAMQARAINTDVSCKRNP
jgi:adenosylmethionine-8-amino-7-oxononanoate aminotransferase